MRSASLLLDGFHLQFVSLGTFRGENVFPLDIAVDHPNDGIIVFQVENHDRHGILPQLFTSVLPAMTGNQFVSTFLSGSGDRRNKDPIFFDTSYQLLHSRIIPNAIGV